MNLPESNALPIHTLAACFNKTSATYKYYWFLSILQEVEEGGLKMDKKALFARMLSNAWYTVNYFNVSFGKQDLIQDTIFAINNIEPITIDEKRASVYNKLIRSQNPQTLNLLRHFDKNVPHWFLSPWFPKIDNETYAQRKKRIYSSSANYEYLSIYRLDKECIEINPNWIDYLVANAGILKDFCYWNLALFLQSRNPNVPDIPNKLIKPATRNSLTSQREKFWDIVLDDLGSINCIYTGKELTKGNYAVEHFIPHSFVSHDLIWNLIPADKSFNSSKSNKLPILDKHFKPFFELQKSAFEIVRSKTPKNKFLEEYFSVFHHQEDRLNETKFFEIIQPLVSIASNNGFEFLKQ